MRLSSIFLYNRAPFDRLSISFDNENITILSGINGAGKTTILSYIVDSFFELAKNVYHNEFEGKTNKFYRLSSEMYSLENNKPSIVYLRFIDNEVKNIDYVDILGKLSEEYYDSLISLTDKVPFSIIEKELKQEDVIKHWSISNRNDIFTLFSDSLLTYFPSYRYEEPAYLNKPYSVDLSFNKEASFSGFLPNPIEVTSDLPQIANWIMDLVLDRQIYKGTASAIFDQLNNVINLILSSKTGHITRLGIGPRNSGESRIAVMDRNDNNHQIYPSIFNMSSGELSLLCIFGEILKQADKEGKTSDDVKGIVLIDEIDKHLHITLQRQVLPKLFAMFPKIQFIISSHSPFIGLGLDEETSVNYKICDLDNGGMPSHLQDVELFRDVYDMMIGENNKYLVKYTELQSIIEENTKPLIITEGKTDWKHIEAAKKRLHVTDLDIEFHEYEDTLGDETLLQLLKEYARVMQSRRIIGIFDRDNFNKLKCSELEKQEYITFNNNVYAFAIPLVNGDEYGNEISIEHYYRREDLTKKDENGRRIYLGSEFYESGLSKDGKLFTQAKGRDKKIKSNGIIDEKVYNIKDDPEGNVSIALSKNDFATLILSEDHFAEDFDFSEYQKIFDVIRKIVNE